MRRKKIAVLITFIIAVTAQTAFAKVDSYGVKNQKDQVISYDKIELQQSFIQNKRGGDSKIYNEFLSNIQSGNFISFHDDSGKEVSYKDITEAFIAAKRSGKSFNVDEFVKNAKGMELENNDKEDKEIKDEDTGIKVRDHSEMVKILKDMSDGIYSDKFVTDEYAYFEEPMDKFGDYEYLSLDNFKSIIKKNPYLEKKYFKNKEYSDLIDLKNYMELPNLTINFDKLNHINGYDLLVDGFIKTSPTQKKSDIPENEIIFPLSDITKPDIRWCFSCRLDRDPRFFKVIWRNDIEESMVDEINKIRVSKGMKPLKVKNDLYAMARFGAKRSQYGFSKSGTTNQLETSRTGQERYWVPGVIPFPWKHEKKIDIEHEILYKGYEGYVKLEDKAKELFNYNGKVKAISWDSNFYTTAKQFLDKWQISAYSDDIIFTYGVTSLKDLQNSLPDNIFNPNMKYIGVGSTYEIPIQRSCHNGILGVFVVVGE